ncbi:MAG: hypothetical protein H6852_11210 [Geminicoccaceae bacterium]|nr:hypothetical protein [Geminicoccaceae bacterium]
MGRTRYILAVDGGATKTRAALAPWDGEVVAEAVGGPCNLFQDPAAGLAEIRALWQRLCATAGLDPAGAAADTAISAGLAGTSAPGSGDRFRAAFADFATRHLSSDGYVALIGAVAGRPGALLSIGTGVVGFRLDASGAHRQLSGWGFPVGDRGGGAWLGLRAIGDWLERLDGYGGDAASTLWPLLQDRLGSSPADILAWLKGARPAEFASLAPFVVERAAAGDPHARSLIDEAAGHHVRLARALAATATEPLVLAGGLAEVFRPAIAAALGPALDQSGRIPSPLAGALLIARGRNAAEFPEA